MKIHFCFLSILSLCLASIKITSNPNNLTLLTSFLSDLSIIFMENCYHNIVPLDLPEIQQEIILQAFNYGQIHRETISEFAEEGRAYISCCNYFYYQPGQSQILAIISKLRTKNQCLASGIFFFYDHYNETLINFILKATNTQYLDVFILSQRENERFSIYGTNGFGSNDVKTLGTWRQGGKWNNVQSLFWDKTRNLHGYNLTIVGLPYIPCTKVDSNELKRTNGNLTASYHGLDITILNNIRKQRNFQYHIVEPPDRQWGILLENDTWTGIVGYLQNRKADVAIGCTALTSSRANYVDFAQPHIEDFVEFVTSLPLNLPKWKSLIFPFNLIVWPFIFVTFAAVFLVSELLCKFWILRDLNEPVEIMTWITIIKIFWSQGVPANRLYTHGLPLFLAAWVIYSFFITQAYICNLVSYFTANPKDNPVDTIPELAKSNLKITWH